VRTSLPLSSLKKSNRTGVAVRDAAGDEMAPRAGVRCLLNRLSLIREIPPEGARFDGLAERQLLSKAFSVAARYGKGGEEASLVSILLLVPLVQLRLLHVGVFEGRI
jgi:hypothetical protein